MNADAKKHAAAFGWFGILAVAAFCIIWLACYSIDTAWVWGENSISDFGTSDTDAASYFKYGLVVAGILLAIFGIGETVNRKTFGYVLSGIVTVIAGLCVVMVGLFTLDYEGGDLHHFFATIMAILMAASALAFAGQSFYCNKILRGGIVVVLFTVVIGTAFAFEFEEFEVWAAVCAIIFYGMYSVLTVAENIERD